MIERASPARQSKSVLVFEQAQSASTWIAAIGAAAFALVTLAASLTPSAGSGGVVIGWLLFAAMFCLIAARRWIAEIDLRARTLRISRRSFGRRKRTIVDCTLDQCRQLGRIEYETDGHLSYGVYVEIADGTRHGIPLSDSTFQGAGRVAAELSEATGIPRLDTKS